MKKHLPLIIFLLCYFCYILLTYKTFGITWDEQAVYERGKMLYEHLIDPDKKFDSNLVIKKSEKDVWPSYNNSYAAVLFAFNKDQSYERYHLLNLLFGTLIFISNYFFLYKKYKKPWLAILGPLFLVLNPRFFGHLAANPKDMPFAILYFVCVASIYFFSSLKNVLLKVLIFGFLFSFTQSIRTIGFSLYFILFIYDFLKQKKSVNFFLQEFLYISIIFFISNFFMIISWPYIGSNYFKNFADVLQISKSFPWEGTVFFLGKNYFSLNLPRFYLPIFFVIGTPLFIFFSAIGSLFLLKKNFLKNEVLLLANLVIFINTIFYFVLKPVVYNGLRHFLFLLPFFSTLAAVFVIESFSWKKMIKRIFLVFVSINSLLVIVAQIKLFPYQYLYYNELVGGLKGASRYFETDYWNASFREGILWLEKNVTNDKKKRKIYTCGTSLSVFYYFTDNLEWVANYDQADFAICYTGSAEYKKIPGKIIHTVQRDSVPLNYVIQIK